MTANATRAKPSFPMVNFSLTVYGCLIEVPYDTATASTPSGVSSMTTIAVVVRHGVLAVLRHGGLDFIEPGAESSALHGVQSRQPQGHLQLRGRHSQVAAHDVVERHIVIGVGKISGGIRCLGDHLGLVRRRFDHIE